MLRLDNRSQFDSKTRAGLLVIELRLHNVRLEVLGAQGVLVVAELHFGAAKQKLERLPLLSEFYRRLLGQIHSEGRATVLVDPEPAKGDNRGVLRKRYRTCVREQWGAQANDSGQGQE